MKRDKELNVAAEAKWYRSTMKKVLVDDGVMVIMVVLASEGISASASYDGGKRAPRFRNIARETLRNILSRKINNLSHASRSSIDANEGSLSRIFLRVHFPLHEQSSSRI